MRTLRRSCAYDVLGAWAVVAFTCLLLNTPHARADADHLTAEMVSGAQPAANEPSKISRALLAKTQILLDQARFSPGEIDGKKGENFDKALRGFAKAHGLTPNKNLTKEVWAKLLETSAGSVLADYQITADDLKGPFIPKLPAKMEEMKSLEALSYTSAVEALAERFHMSEELLRALNKDRNFDRAGTTITVANIRKSAPSPRIRRIEIDKTEQVLRGFDNDDKLVAFYPATVGSDDKPSPSGTLKVTGVQKNPTYSYNPEYAFKGVQTNEPFTIRPGPNNPVGSIWIGLSEKGYGIHGTPEPSKVSKSESHGCIRLTNWDAEDLGEKLAKNAEAIFKD